MFANMIQLTTTLAVTLAIATVNHVRAQGSTKDLDEKNGFRDAKFGAHFSSFRNMVYSDYPNKKDESYWFSRTTDTLALGDIPLSYITYLFYKSRLIRVGSESEGHFKEIYDTLTEAYGKYTKTDSSRYEGYLYHRYYWQGNKVELQVTKGPKAIGIRIASLVQEAEIDKADALAKKKKRLGAL
jgi:hypothetical protein